jgi:hypothetical protein
LSDQTPGGGEEGGNVCDRRKRDVLEFSDPVLFEIGIDLPSGWAKEARHVLDQGQGEGEASVIRAHRGAERDGTCGGKRGDLEEGFVDEDEINEGGEGGRRPS